MSTTRNNTAARHHNGASTEGNGPSGAPPLPPFGDGGQPAAAEAPKPAAVAGRDSNGRFGKGWKGGPGNPFARQVGQLRSALLDAVTPEDMAEVAKQLVRRAKTGNLAAVKLLLLYAVGRPAEAVNPDELDLDEFRLLDASPTRFQVFRVGLEGLPAEAAVATLGLLLAVKGQEDPATLLHKTVVDRTPGQTELEELRAERRQHRRQRK